MYYFLSWFCMLARFSWKVLFEVSHKVAFRWHLWLESLGDFITLISPAWAGMAGEAKGWLGMSLLTWPLHMTRLGFLTGWWSHLTWWLGPPRASIPRDPDRSYKASNDLSLEITQYQITISICWRSNRLVQIQGGRAIDSISIGK